MWAWSDIRWVSITFALFKVDSGGLTDVEQGVIMNSGADMDIPEQTRSKRTGLGGFYLLHLIASLIGFRKYRLNKIEP